MARTRRPPEDFTQKLLNAAPHFVMSFDEARMEDIAKASGIPRGTLYYYFDGKGEILSFLCTTVLARFHEVLVEIVKSEGDTKTRLEAVIRAQVEAHASSPAISQLLISHQGELGKPSELGEQVDRLCLDPIRTLLQDGMRRKEVGAINVPTAAVAIYAAMNVAAITSVVLGVLDVDQLTADLMAVLWNGVGARVPARAHTH